MHSREISKFAMWKGLYIHTDLKDNKHKINNEKSDNPNKFS